MSPSASRSRSRSHSRSGSRRRSNSKHRSKQIFVTRISRRTNSQDLRDVFRRYGHIRNVSMKRSYAFIEYSDYNDAQYGILSSFNFINNIFP
jgi:RNA recognition motif-containing protein